MGWPTGRGSPTVRAVPSDLPDDATHDPTDQPEADLDDLDDFDDDLDDFDDLAGLSWPTFEERAPMVAAAIAELADGPLLTTTLVRRLSDAGVLAPYGTDDPDELLDAVEEDLLCEIGLWVWRQLTASAAQILDRRTFTHRLTAAEHAAGILQMTPDLSHLDLDLGDDDDMVLTTGGVANLVEQSTLEGGTITVIEGPDGWLAGLEPGELLGLTWIDGELAVAAVEPDTLGDGRAEAETLAHMVRRYLRPGHGTEVFPAVADLLVASAAVDNPALEAGDGLDPAVPSGLFRQPVPPLGELLADAGFRCDRGWVGPQDEEWKTPIIRLLGARRERLAANYGFSSCCHAAFDEVERAWNAFTTQGAGHTVSPDPAWEALDLRSAARALGHDPVAEAFGAWTLDGSAPAGPILAAFADALLEVATGRAAAGPHHLAAIAAEVAGEVDDAAQHLRAALAADEEHLSSAAVLSLHALMRGDLDQATRLRRRLDEPDDPQLAWLEAVRPKAASGVGRNEPCPCGSGKRFKQCCLRDPKPDPRHVTDVVTRKLAIFGGRRVGRSSLVGLATSAWSIDSGTMDDLVALTNDPFIIDLWLWDHAVAEPFLEIWGPVLPSTERELTERWLDTPRRLWQVERVDPTDGLTLRELGQEGSVVVLDTPITIDLEPGELVLARFVEVGDHPQLAGSAVPVPPDDRDLVAALLDSGADCDTWARWYGGFLPDDEDEEDEDEDDELDGEDDDDQPTGGLPRP